MTTITIPAADIAAAIARALTLAEPIDDLVIFADADGSVSCDVAANADLYDLEVTSLYSYRDYGLGADEDGEPIVPGDPSAADIDEDELAEVLMIDLEDVDIKVDDGETEDEDEQDKEDEEDDLA